MRLQIHLVLLVVFSLGVFGSCNKQNIKNRKVVSLTVNDNILFNDTLTKNSLRNLTITTLENSAFYLSPQNMNWYSDSTVALYISSVANDEREEALTIWKLVCDNTYHSTPLSSNGQEINSPSVLFNAFQYGWCDDRNAAMVNLAIACGLKARVIELKGHVVGEIFYNEDWHMFDADKHIYYTNERGDILSVKQLEENPDYIASKTNQLRTFAERIRNRLSARAISSKNNNHVENSYLSVSGYKSVISLSKGDVINFHSAPAPNLLRFISRNILARNGPVFTNTGTFKRSGTINSTNTILEFSLPYPVTKLSVSSAQSSDVFFSVDSVNWSFMGKSLCGSDVVFDVTEVKSVPYSFKYYLKFAGSAKNQTSNKVTVKSDFMFSDLILGSIPAKGFGLYFIKPQEGDVSVVYSRSDEIK